MTYANIALKAPSILIESGRGPAARTQAAGLVGRKYHQRGYPLAPWDSHCKDEIILIAKHHTRPCGTLTMGMDAYSLHAQETYPREVRALHDQGLRLAELTRLAIDAPEDNRLIMAALFDYAWHELHAHPAINAAVIEVHPRHAPFYVRRFGFTQIGGERICLRAKAPSVLLALWLPAQCRLPTSQPGNQGWPSIGPVHPRARCRAYSD